MEELKRRGLNLGIATSRTEREFRDEAEPKLPFTQGFGPIVLADHTKRHKPHPDPLLKYMELSGAAPNEVLYLGDTAADAGCAQGAGVDFALAGWGSHETVPAKYRLAQPRDLLDCLD